MNESEKDFEIRRKLMILHINKVCREEWSLKDDKKGKTLRVRWSNRAPALSVLHLYEENGWIIKREALLEKSGRFLFITIKRPKKPKS